MATYYVNPAGGNTDRTNNTDAPTNFTELIAFGALADGDTIYLEGDGSPIVEPNGDLLLKGTFLKNPASTNRPSISYSAFGNIVSNASTYFKMVGVDVTASDPNATMLTIDNEAAATGYSELDGILWSGGFGFVDLDESLSTGIKIVNCIIKDTTTLGIKYSGPLSAGNITISNNTIYNCSSVNEHNAGLRFRDSVAGDVCTNNIVAFPNQGLAPNTKGREFSGTGLCDYNLSFGHTTNYHDIAKQANELEVDPLFTNAGADDFTLQVGSPAIDVGTNSVATVDFSGKSRPFGAAFDMGVHEYGVADSEDPEYATGYPKIKNIQETTADALVKINEAGTAYVVVVPNNSSIPTKTQIKAGQDGSGASAIDSATDTLVADTEKTLNLTGLSKGIDYDVYVLAEDDAGNSKDAVRLDINRIAPVVNNVAISSTGTLGKTSRHTRRINLSSFVAIVARWGVISGEEVVGVSTGSPGVNHVLPVIPFGTSNFSANDITIGKVRTIEDLGARVTVNLNGYVEGIQLGEHLIVSVDAGDEGKLRSQIGATPGTYETVARAEFVSNDTQTLTFSITDKRSVVIS